MPRELAAVLVDEGDGGVVDREQDHVKDVRPVWRTVLMDFLELQIAMATGALFCPLLGLGASTSRPSRILAIRYPRAR
jgi:hypothetical protein